MATSTAERTGDNVRAEMARRGISQMKLAARMNLSQTAVSARLRGVTAFNVDELTLVADFLGVTADSLLPKPESVPDEVGAA